jgi:signal transduction histidine kinase
MNQLFYNLMNNALKFSHVDRKPVIQITASKSGDPTEKTGEQYQRFLQISFKDNGIGFEQQYALKIFDMFQQLNEKRTYGGTGIGLALCKNIVENHNGSISARSTPGEGAEFDIALPMAQTQRHKHYTYTVARKPA